MYCVQPLLPELADAFNVSAASSSLAVSLTTGTLAATLLVSGLLTERVARKPMIVLSLAVTALLTTAGTAASSWTMFLMSRALAGVAFAGLPAIAMAYIGEEMAPRVAGLSMGIYVAGTAVGGMSGRLLAAMLTDAYGWRSAVAATGVFGLVTAGLVAALLPSARHLRKSGSDAPGLFEVYRTHLRNGQLRRMYALGFLFMGAFVAVYNYLTFRLVEPPYALDHSALGLVFLIYLVGLISSPWAGAAAGTRGRRRALALSLILMLVGAALTMAAPLAMIVTAVGLLTFGFFAAHSVTSTWVGRHAGGHRAQASSLYIVFYYVGASVTGTIAGTFWARYGWPGVTVLVAAQLLVALWLLSGMRAD